MSEAGITIVGAGFLGSLLAEELGKRLFAFEMAGSFPVRVVDFDSFEERNMANQNVRIDGVGQPKAKVVGGILSGYGVSVMADVAKLTEENVDRLLADSLLLVSAADNYPCRLLLWQEAIKTGTPLLTLGVSQQGTGQVDWTLGTEFDSWSLSPVALGSRKPPTEMILPTLKPCDLIALRGLGLNTALAGAKAAMIYFGKDAEKYFGDAPPDIGTLTTWATTNASHKMLEALSFDEAGRETRWDAAVKSASSL